MDVEEFMEKQGKSITEKPEKIALKNKNKGKADKDLKQTDLNEILIQIAKDLGYL
jgi:hypothetical protein